MRRVGGLLLVAGAMILMSLTAAAQTQSTLPSVGRSTFKVITEVQELQEQERYVEAIAVLEQLVIDTRGNDYDHAIANQYLAHNSVMMEDIARARSALVAALASETIPPQMRAELSLFYGSVLLGDEEYAQAAQLLEDWLATATAPLPRQLFTVGYANYMNGSLERAQELLARAIEDSLGNAQDSWYQVHYRVLFDLKRYDEGEAVLYEVLNRDPSVALHWRMLASHYLQLEQSSDALAAIMLSYMNNQIEKTEDLKQIVSLYGYVDIPEKAARLLEGWMQEGKIETNADTWKQLGNLWLLSRERDKAKEALTIAASESPDGRTYVMLGGIYFEDEDWESAYKAYQQALSYGGVEEPQRVSLLAGMSAFWAGMEDEARESLGQAAESDDYKRQAEAIIKKMDEA
jgi:tetratricopeptide (TPR) repeat protein